MQKTFFLEQFFVGVLKVNDENSRIRIRIHWSKAWIRGSGSGSTPKFHGSATLPQGIRVLFQTCIPDDVQHRVLAHKVSGPEGEEVGGPGIVHQQLNDAGPHPPVPLVDQMVSATCKRKLLKRVFKASKGTRYWVTQVLIQRLRGG
jgi:hypothetical protein